MPQAEIGHSRPTMLPSAVQFRFVQRVMSARTEL
jgi:hypothetical protein